MFYLYLHFGILASKYNFFLTVRFTRDIVQSHTITHNYLLVEQEQTFGKARHEQSTHESHWSGKQFSSV